MKIKNIEERIKRIWNKSWWAKVIGVILIFFLWPFIVGWLLLRLIFKRVSNIKLRWALSIVILLPTLLFGTAWVVAFFIPVSLHLDLDTVPPTNQSQATVSGKTLSGKLVEVLKGGQVVAETTADGTGKFRIEVKDLAEGENQFVVRVCKEKKEQEDVAQCIEKTITILVDKTPPPSPSY